MEPEEIESREFFVGLRGYDKDEVNAFLTDVAAEVRALQDALAAARVANEAAASEPRDDLEDLGSSVAAIVRAAKESARSILSEAEGRAAQLRADAEAYAEARRHAADDYAEAKRHEGDEAHASATDRAREAEERANRLVQEAEERARVILDDAEARARQQVEAVIADAAARLEETTRRSEDLRVRLAETADELQLAVLALGDPVQDPEAALRAAVNGVDQTPHDR